MHSPKSFFSTALFITTFLLLCGCNLSSPHYQKNYSVPGNKWKSDFKPDFKFKIEDTTAFYNLYFLIRHTDAYPFSNIWLWVYTKKPGDSVFQRSRIEIPLAETSGKWLGRGMGEIWEQRMPITNDNHPMLFNKQGTYEIRFEQNMRLNPLPEILQVGLRVSKMGNSKSKTAMNP